MGTNLKWAFHLMFTDLKCIYSSLFSSFKIRRISKRRTALNYAEIIPSTQLSDDPRFYAELQMVPVERYYMIINTHIWEDNKIFVLFQPKWNLVRILSSAVVYTQETILRLRTRNALSCCFDTSDTVDVLSILSKYTHTFRIPIDLAFLARDTVVSQLVSTQSISSYCPIWCYHVAIFCITYYFWKICPAMYEKQHNKNVRFISPNRAQQRRCVLCYTITITVQICLQCSWYNKRIGTSTSTVIGLRPSQSRVEMWRSICTLLTRK